MAAALGLFVALAAKFAWPLVVFHLPLGYDTGIYRYLFLRHAAAFPPLFIAPMDVWAREHPLGIFFFSTLFLRAGVPVDWLLGWLWNAFCVAICLCLAWSTAPRFGKRTALCTLLTALLSVALFYGFAAMYWKTFAALLFCVLAYRGLDRGAWWTPLPAVLAVACHHQTGLLFGLVLATVAVLSVLRPPRGKQRGVPASVLPVLIAGSIAAGVGLLWYLPVWQGAIGSNLGLLLKIGGSAPAGSFPGPTFFLAWSAPLYALGGYGLVQSLRSGKLGTWELSVLWPLLLVCIGYVFRNRFLLHLDFFLLPFAAAAITHLWSTPKLAARVVLIKTLVIQAILTLSAVTPLRPACALLPALCTAKPPFDARPLSSPGELAVLEEASRNMEPDATVLALDPVSAPFVRGWLMTQHVSGPGIFDHVFDYKGWEMVVLGTNEGRLALMAPLKRPLYLYVSPFFTGHYGATATITSDPCVATTPWAGMLRWTCDSPERP